MKMEEVFRKQGHGKDSEGYYGAWDWEKDKSKAGVYLTEADEIKSNYTSKKSTIKAGGNIL